jgi:hypothetical protein
MSIAVIESAVKEARLKEWRAMIDMERKLSIRTQCKLLGLHTTEHLSENVACVAVCCTTKQWQKQRKT